MAGIPFVKKFSFEYGRPDRLSPLIRRVIANNPSPFTYVGTGTYIVGKDEGPLAVIDPGPSLDAHLDALVAAIGDAFVTDVLVTHTHSDHCGGARAFATRVKAPIRAFGAHPSAERDVEAPAVEEGADRAFRPDAAMADGESARGEGWTLEAVATPGHLSNHLCFALVEEKALFTGDHIMGWSTSVVAPPDGDMGDYLESLDKLLARDETIYYPTHGPPILKPKAFVRAVKAHRRIRDGQILDQLKKGRTRIADIAAAIYADIDPRLHAAAALNVHAHLIRLVQIGAVRADGGPGMHSVYALT